MIVVATCSCAAKTPVVAHPTPMMPAAARDDVTIAKARTSVRPRGVDGFVLGSTLEEVRRACPNPIEVVDSSRLMLCQRRDEKTFIHMKDGTVCGVMLWHDRRSDEGDAAWWNRFMQITRESSASFGEPNRIESSLESTCTSAPACIHAGHGHISYQWDWAKAPELGIVVALGREDGTDVITTHYLEERCYDDDGTKAETTNVQFDDVGIRFVIPETFHVVGNDDLAERVRRNVRDVHLRRGMLKQMDPNSGSMLVAIATNDGNEELTVSVAVTTTDKSQDAMALAQHDVKLMSENFRHLEVTSAPTKLVTDDVDGIEWSSRYFIDGHPRNRIASRMRVYIRGDVTVIAGAIWPDGNPKLAERAPRALDGLHFQPR